MKRFLRFAAKLYPKAWLDRYSDEFEALLDDVGASRGIALDVLRGAVFMQVQHWRRTGMAALLATVIVLATSWWAGQRPYITPGTHQVFRMDSTPGALLEFLVLMIMAAVGVVALASAGARWSGDFKAAGVVFAGIAASYMTAIVLVSLLTPRTIVSIGDSYCWDLWCMGIQSVNAAARGDNLLYTAEVSLFVDSTTAELELTGLGDATRGHQPKQPFYVVNERGHRFPILAYSSLGAAKMTVKPGESVKFSLTFLAPANARRLYLTGDVKAPVWVRLYFGSDLNPFHRRTLLRVA